jgi:hypothetical protein
MFESFDYRIKNDGIGDYLKLKISLNYDNKISGKYPLLDSDNVIIKNRNVHTGNAILKLLEIDCMKRLKTKTQRCGYYTVYGYRLNRNKK